MGGGEFAFLERLRAVATHPAARGLADDAALLGDLVLTHDMIGEGVHFLPGDPPALVGWKLVAVNLSDLAAKGAEPLAALMGMSLSGDADWDAAFLDGVAEACTAFGLALIGGDTIALPRGAPKVFGLTAIGRAGAVTPSRCGQPGDALWLVGTIGDSGAGLRQLRDNPEANGALVDAYRRPLPLIEAGRALAPHASAMMDISDGLLIDAQRMAAASGCAIRLDLGAVPLSPAFVSACGDDRAVRLFASTAGDDYALLAAIPADVDPALSLSLPNGTRLTRLGSLAAGEGISLFDAAGEIPVPERTGYAHDPD